MKSLSLLMVGSFLFVTCAASLDSLKREEFDSPASTRDVPVELHAVTTTTTTTTAIPSPTGDCLWHLEGENLIYRGEDFEYDARSTKGVDLDGIPPLDLIADLGNCGNWGDCEFVVLQACETGRYRAVWGPEYAQDIEVAGRTEGAVIVDLLLVERTARTGCDLLMKTVIIWNGERWVYGESCADGGIWDERDCGERPPACGQ